MGRTFEGEYEVLSGKVSVDGPETGWKGVPFCQETTDLLNKKEDLDRKVDFGSFSMLWGWPIVVGLFVGLIFYCAMGFVEALI